MSWRMLITKELELTIQRAFAEARRRRHDTVTVEHLLLALLEDATVAAMLEASGVDLADVRRELVSTLDVWPGGAREATPSAAFWRILQRAIYQAEASGDGRADTGRALLFLFQEKDSHAVYLLQSHNVSRLDVMSYLTHGLTRHDFERQLRREDAPPAGQPAASGAAACARLS